MHTYQRPYLLYIKRLGGPVNTVCLFQGGVKEEWKGMLLIRFITVKTADSYITAHALDTQETWLLISLQQAFIL